MRRKKSVRAFGIAAVVVLGATACIVTSAQANWLVLHNGVIVEPDVNVKVKAHTEINLLVKEETNLEVLCSVLEEDITRPILLLEKSSVAHGKVKLKTCKTWQGGKEKPGCKPKEPIGVSGLALTALHNSKIYVLLEPDPGVEAFTSVEFNGETCGLPEKNKVTGEALFECGDLAAGGGGWVELNCITHEVTHLIREAPETSALFEHKLRYGTKKALVDGIAAVEISSPALYVGDAWSGHS